MNDIFRGIFDSETAAVIRVTDFLLCIGISLLCGIFLAFCYAHRCRHTRSFLITLAMLPAVVCVVIMMVNGNVGTGVAVAGAFSLVRFRSVPGSSRDICILFLAMASGIGSGMGYIWYSLIFTIAISLIVLIAEKLIPSEHNKNSRLLRILVTEDMDYNGLFDDIFNEYTTKFTLQFVKSVRMGTMFDLQYVINMKDVTKEKEMLDKIRCRNGNLTVSCGLVPVNRDEL